jgi:hypothetical protein
MRWRKLGSVVLEGVEAQSVVVWVGDHDQPRLDRGQYGGVRNSCRVITRLCVETIEIAQQQAGADACMTHSIRTTCDPTLPVGVVTAIVTAISPPGDVDQAYGVVPVPGS